MGRLVWFAATNAESGSTGEGMFSGNFIANFSIENVKLCEKGFQSLDYIGSFLFISFFFA